MPIFYRLELIFRFGFGKRQKLDNNLLAIMIVNDEVRKCVVFVGLRKANGEFRLAGTAFFLDKPVEGQENALHVWAITARHVIDKIRETGVAESYLRLNNNNGQTEWVAVPLNEWHTHPTDKSIDVAVLKFQLLESSDHKVIPYSMCGTDDKLKEKAVGLGDEVFVTGLFIHHHGSKKNIPIVRVGNVACLSEERVVTEQFGEIDAYLIEARSIGGLSGSPVFVNLGHTRTIGGTTYMGAGGQILLLGLIHGHYDVKAEDIDMIEDTSKNQHDSINTGIAIVVPFNNIDSTISACEK